MYKILLVDDEEIERIVLKKFLSKMNPPVLMEEADGGNTAMKKFEVFEPDIVIMDIKMPGLDGIEAARRMKRIRKECVVIFLTAYVEAEKIHDCIFSGGEAYLQKPVRENDLINTVRRFLRSENQEVQQPDYRKLLIEKILARNYKASKEALRDLLLDQQKTRNGSMLDRKAESREIADEIIGTLDQLDIKNKEYINSSREILNEINGVNDAYSLRTWLFKVLDYVFSAVVLEHRGFQDNEIDVVLNYLEKNYYKRVTLEEVAEYINISPFYLSKIFKKCTCINFIDYLTDLKIEKAKELLEYTDIPVINIAMELSFNEPNYFTRVFRKIVGVTPSKYREEKRASGSQASRIRDIRWYV